MLKAQPALLAFLVCVLPNSAQNKAAKPTLQETKAYITHLLEAEFVLPGEYIKLKENSVVIEHVDNASFLGCRLTYDVSATSDRMTYTYSQAVELSTVYEISVGTIGDIRPYSIVTLRLSRPVTRTRQITAKTGDTESRKVEEKSLEIFFHIRNDDTAKRLQNAFATATGMCGAKPDPFASR
jgi:hypothetical protein